MNVKSGACPENCRFCSQSGHHHTDIEVFPLIPADAMLSAAGRAHTQGIRTFGIVTSGTGYLRIDAEFTALLESLRRLRQAFPDMEICGAFGTLSEETAQALAATGMARYNINLQTSPDRYPELIATTHTIEGKIETIRWLHKYGVECCTGGILGLGESMEDRVKMAWAVADLAIEVIPLNVLIPIPGTAAEKEPPVPVAEIAKSFALFRLINPAAVIKFAAGRETRMKDFQGLLMLAGANGLLTGGYLTTRGREISEDRTFLKELESFDVR
jgi:biotin synthase